MSSHSSDPPLQHSVKNPAEMRAAALRVAPIGEGIRLWKDAGYYRMLQDVLLSAWATKCSQPNVHLKPAVVLQYILSYTINLLPSAGFICACCITWQLCRQFIYRDPTSRPRKIRNKPETFETFWNGVYIWLGDIYIYNLVISGLDAHFTLGTCWYHRRKTWFAQEPYKPPQHLQEASWQALRVLEAPTVCVMGQMYVNVLVCSAWWKESLVLCLRESTGSDLGIFNTLSWGRLPAGLDVSEQGTK